MIRSILLEARAEGDPWWERPGALRALAYAVLHRGDPALAASLHPPRRAAGGDLDGAAEENGRPSPTLAASGGGDLRPFTIAALPDGRRGRVGVRVTGLEERASRALVVAAASVEGGERLRFGDGELATLGCHLDASSDPLAGGTTYGALARAPFRPRVRLRFVTPTAFSQGGDRHLPLPVPELMVRSWAARWNRFGGPFALPPGQVAALQERVVLAAARIETAVLALEPLGRADRRPARQVGFAGEVELEAHRAERWSEADRQAFAALVEYSRYCGTGARTTQGLGLTLPLEDEVPRAQPLIPVGPPC